MSTGLDKVISCNQNLSAQKNTVNEQMIMIFQIYPLSVEQSIYKDHLDGRDLWILHCGGVDLIICL